MKVLIVVGHGGIYAGGAHQALYAIRGLINSGVEVGAVWGEDAEADRRGFNRLKDLNIPLWILPIHKRPTLPSVFRLWKVIRQFKPDVIEAFKSGAQYHCLLAGLFQRRHALVFYRGISRPMEWGQALKYRLNRVDRIIANCNDLKTIMATSGHIKVEKIDVVPGEFDPACADPHKVDARGLRAELGIPHELPLITQLGNYAPWRGQMYMLEAAAILKRHGVGFHLLFAGRENERLLPAVKKLGLEKSVTLSKYRRDPERLLKESMVVVNASVGNESLPGSLLNAQAMGTPCVATSMPGSADIVEDGVTGFIVPPGDASALAAAVGTIIQMPQGDWSRLSRNARTRAQKLFSSEQRAKLRIESYRKAMEHRGMNLEG